MTNIEAKLYPLLPVKNSRFDKTHSTILYRLALHNWPSLSFPLGPRKLFSGPVASTFLFWVDGS